jgi:hypothetical protein
MNTKPVIKFVHSKLTMALIGGALLGTSLFAQAADLKIVAGRHSRVWSAGLESLDFQAVQHSDGTVTGQAQVSLRNGNDLIFISHLRIDCMHFLDDRTVILGGVDVLDSDAEYVGDTVAFVVRDNGQGQGAAPDERTRVYYSTDVGFEVSCEVAVELIESGAYDPVADFYPAEEGNIQVKP